MVVLRSPAILIALNVILKAGCLKVSYPPAHPHAKNSTEERAHVKVRQKPHVNQDKSQAKPYFMTTLKRSYVPNSRLVEAKIPALSRYRRVSPSTERKLLSRIMKGIAFMRQTPTFAKTDIHDIGTEYVGNIGVGTVSNKVGCEIATDGSLRQEGCDGTEVAQQELSVVYDTGSTNLWMASTLCTDGPCMNEDRHRYDHRASRTFREPEDPQEMDINFVTAELKGPLGIDNFHIGPFTVKNQSFALIREELGETFQETPIEGIVGLAFPSLAAEGTHPFFDNVIDQKVLPKNMFSFYLSSWGERDSAASLRHLESYDTETSGAILWGGFDEDLVQDDIKYVPVSHALWWGVDFDGFYLGDEQMTVRESSSLKEKSKKKTKESSGAYGRIIFDSGTTLYAADDVLLADLQDKLPSESCEKVGSYPIMTFKFKDDSDVPFDLKLGPEQYMVRSADGECHLGFMRSPPNFGYGPSMTFGELFMQDYFTIFDRGDGSNATARVGFAKAQSGKLSSLLSRARP